MFAIVSRSLHRINRVFYGFLMLLIHFYVAAKYWILRSYYDGLAVQARHLYRNSDLFKARWEALGYEYAMESFKGGTGIHFFYKARNEPVRIRFRIFMDTTIGRKPRAYYISEGGF